MNFRVLVVSLWVWLAGNGLLHAHGLLATVKTEPDRILIEAFYDDDTPADGARVELFQDDGLKIEEVRTDAQGKAEIARSLASGRYRLVVDAGAGHRVEKRFQVGLEAEATDTQEPDRRELTAVPWPRIAIGLGVVAIFALVLWLLPKPAKNSNS